MQWGQGAESRRCKQLHCTGSANNDTYKLGIADHGLPRVHFGGSRLWHAYGEAQSDVQGRAVDGYRFLGHGRLIRGK